mgnify:CR=1 FL=1
MKKYQLIDIRDTTTSLVNKDTRVGDYVIPKGVLILANLSKFLREPDVFENPDEFVPDRFIDVIGDDRKLKIRKVDQFAPFGLGKRICMGETLARNELFLFFVMMLQHLEFRVPDDPSRRPDPAKFTQGITTIPLPYYVRVIPRHIE